MTFEELQLRCLVVGASGLVYWGGVMLHARRIRRQIGRSPNVRPRGLKERALWFGWFMVIAVWLGQPLVLANKGTSSILALPGWWQAVSLALGLGMVVLGYAGTLWSYAAMGRTWRMGINRNEKTTLVTHGPYRWVRHPIYGLQMVMLAGAALLLPTVISVVALGLHYVCVLIKLQDEEIHLDTTLGEPYRDYLHHTGRLFPRLIGRR